MTSLVLVEAVICGLSVLPVLVGWQILLDLPLGDGMGRLLLLSVAVAPSYVEFALLVMFLSAFIVRLVGWRTPADTTMRIDEMDWPLLTWVRYVTSIHVVRVFAGRLFCGSPIWTSYLRLNGAKLGRRVYVNSPFVSDHNLLEFDDGVVIGSEVHLSGHTAEHGVIRTGSVRLGRNVTIGLSSVIDIDVEAGPGCQVGALSFVPKHARLEAGAVYVGIPVHRLPDH